VIPGGLGAVRSGFVPEAVAEAGGNLLLGGTSASRRADDKVANFKAVECSS